MKRNYIRLSIAAAMFIIANTAFAEEFFIVREQATGLCRVVRERPTDMAFVVVTETAYTTEENALGVIKTVCEKHPDPSVSSNPSSR